MMNLNMNNIMMFNQNNGNQNNKELILDLMNQNIQISNQLQMNNNMIKTMIENFNQSKDIFNELYSIDFFPLKSGRKINVIFKDSSGIKITVITPTDATMQELLEAFYIKFQIYAKYYDKKIDKLKNYYFMYRNHKISFDEKKTISEYGLSLTVEDIFFNLNNSIIGG